MASKNSTSASKASSTRRVKANAHQKEDRSKISSFLYCASSEPMIASYLGYEDLGNFRQLQLSFPVLEVFQVYLTHCSGATSPKISLELLSDLPDLERKLPEDLDEAVHKYTALPESSDPGSKKIETATTLKYLMATLLFRLGGRLESPRDYTAAEIDTRQAAAVSNFLQATKITLPNNVNVSSLVFPSLGPHIDLEGRRLGQVQSRVQSLTFDCTFARPQSIQERFRQGRCRPISIYAHTRYLKAALNGPHPSAYRSWKKVASTSATAEIDNSLLG